MEVAKHLDHILRLESVTIFESEGVDIKSRDVLDI
jgi:hypothetical protein